MDGVQHGSADALRIPADSDWFTVQPHPSNGVFQLIPTSGMHR